MSAEVRVGLTSVLTGNKTLLDLNALLEIFFLLTHGDFLNQNKKSYLKANDKVCK